MLPVTCAHNRQPQLPTHRLPRIRILAIAPERFFSKRAVPSTSKHTDIFLTSGVLPIKPMPTWSSVAPIIGLYTLSLNPMAGHSTVSGVPRSGVLPGSHQSSLVPPICGKCESRLVVPSSGPYPPSPSLADLDLASLCAISPSPSHQKTER